MTYNEALKTWQWQSFRRDFIESKTKGGDIHCDDCGFETPTGTLHVHHRVYRQGLLPWEYDFSDLRLLCKSCHELIHSTENLACHVIRTLPPHVCYEFESFLRQLATIDDPRLVKVALARSKNVVQEITPRQVSAGT